MKQLPMHKKIEPFAKDILIIELDEIGTEKKLPFYADGFPGIVYSKSDSPFYHQPKGKKLPNFYLYGLTVEPMTLVVNGAFKLIYIQNYKISCSSIPFCVIINKSMPLPDNGSLSEADFIALVRRFFPSSIFKPSL